MKILTVDIETAPSTAHVWGLWNNNVSLNQLLESGYVLSFAAKWYGEKKIEFRSTFHDGHETMIMRAHELMTEADAIVTWNGDKFDIPTLNREFWLMGMQPPAPSKSIDLLKVARRQFRFLSNKLQYVSTQKSGPGKLRHDGHEMWIKCMADDPAAWKKMATYNKRDVQITEDLYRDLLPWITNHPHAGLYGGDKEGCPRCSSDWVQRRGFATTAAGKFQQFQCQACGTWYRGTQRLDSVQTQGVR